MRFIQRKQFIETNITSHAFQQISNLQIFPDASAGHCKRCIGPVLGPHWPMQSKLCVLHGAS